MSQTQQHPSAPQLPAVVGKMAKQYEMTEAQLKTTLYRTVVPEKTTPAEFVAFCQVAHRYGLSPIMREIYAFPKKGGGIVPIVGVDGWARLMNEHPQMDGLDFEAVHAEDGTIDAVTCTIHRKDRGHPTRVTEYYDENKRGTEPWRVSPTRMLRHRAMIQCARIAFGFTGITDPDEGERVRAPEEVGDVPSAPEAMSAMAHEEPADTVIDAVVVGEDDDTFLASLEERLGATDDEGVAEVITDEAADARPDLAESIKKLWTEWNAAHGEQGADEQEEKGAKDQLDLGDGGAKEAGPAPTMPLATFETAIANLTDADKVDEMLKAACPVGVPDETAKPYLDAAYARHEALAS